MVFGCRHRATTIHCDGNELAMTTRPNSEARLHMLFRAIAARDAGEASRLLRATPSLATAVASIGATRQGANEHFFPQILHYAYAGDTALHLAAAAHQPAIVEDLLNSGAIVRTRNRRGAEPLHYAADGAPDSVAWHPEEQAEVVRLLIEAGADPNATDKSGVAPLHRAVRTRCSAAVRALLEHGADARRTNANGSTPLQLAQQTTGRGGVGGAAARHEQETIVALLRQYGADATDV
jgi:ankyrin repeat protein